MDELVKKEKDELLKKARLRFKDSESAEQENRELFDRDTAFENGEQWTDEDKSERIGRPCIVINKVAGAVKQITGEARKNRPRIKVRPVDQNGDFAIAEVYTALIRNIENISDAESAYDAGYENAVRGGYGYWRVVTDYSDDTTFDQDIRIERIVNPNSVYYDQSSIRSDYSDAKYAFIVDVMHEDKFKEEFPKAQLASFESSKGEEESGWFADNTVRVAEYFYKVKAEKEVFLLANGKTVEIENPKIVEQFVEDHEIGARIAKTVSGDNLSEPQEFKRSRKVKYEKVMWCKMNGQEILEGPNEWPGKYIPIICCSGEEVWIQGKRVFRSTVRHAIDAQRLYNWSRSNTVETLAMAPKQPYHVTPEEIEGHERQWQEAHRKPQAYRLFNEVGLGRPQPSAPSIPNTGAYREAMVSSDDIKSTTGIFDASLGASGNETSGRAIAARQQQGNVATYVFIDNQARAIKYTAQILVDLIPKIYDTQRVVRLLNEDGAVGWLQINYEDPVTGEIVNDISVGRYDITFDVGPNYLTKRIEAADGMTKLAQTAPYAAPVLIPKIAKNLDWPGAEGLGDELKEIAQPQPNPEEQARIKAEVDKLALEVEAKKIDFQIKQIGLEEKKLDYDKTLLELQGKGLELKGKDLDNTKKFMDIQTPHKTG